MEEHNEIWSAIQNGLFNEGIYRIDEKDQNLAEKATNTELKKAVAEHKNTSAEPVSLHVEEPNVDLSVEKKEILSIEKEDSNVIEYFGKNKKSVAILVNYPDERWIYFKDKIILEKILASVKLDFDDVALINTHYYKPETLDILSVKLNIRKLIGFKINDPFLKEFKREEPQKTLKTAIFLMNSDLDEIAMNVDKKRILWNNLKIMFSIS